MAKVNEMNEKISAGIFAFLLILYFPLGINTLTVLSVNPSTIIASVDDTFSVNITISDVNDLGGWEFKLYYLSSKLNGTNLIEGPFLKQGGLTYFAIINFTDNYNATHGIAWVTCVLLGTSLEVDGSGTLAIITFKAQQLGTSVLSFTDTLLSDSQPIPHVALNGTVQILPHDVAITNLTLSKTIIGQGSTAKMDVNVSNQGNFTEAFNVTLYTNTTAIATQTITLTSGNFTTVTLTWNTSGFAKGNYTISAYAWPVQGEMNMENNRQIDGVVRVAILGDLDVDGKVGPYDLYLISRAYGSTPMMPDSWNPNADFNNDNKVGPRDFYLFARNYGKTEP